MKSQSREHAAWCYNYPDDRNRLIADARLAIVVAMLAFKRFGVKKKDIPAWWKLADAFMKETE